MEFRSLLLGSAAALTIVSGAQAADAVVAAEPEPMEYVKVCDAYGTGFFYIPGTETCLKINGTLRHEKRFKKEDGSKTDYENHSRIRLEVEARNDSDWGTVYSWIRLQGDQYDNSGSTITGINLNNGTLTTSNSTDDLVWYYYFGIGGLEFGNWDSPWQKFLGYGFTDDGGYYTADNQFPDSRQYVSYTAEFGSVKAYVSLDNDNDEYKMGGEDHFPGRDENDLRRGHQYMPDVTAGVSTEFGSWTVGGNIAYDESAESVALKGALETTFGMFGFRAFGFWSDSFQNIYFNYDGFSGLLSFEAKVSDSVVLWKDIQFWDNGDWRVVGDVQWTVASGFYVLVEGIYEDRYDVKTKSGFLRFERTF